MRNSSINWCILFVLAIVFGPVGFHAVCCPLDTTHAYADVAGLLCRRDIQRREAGEFSVKVAENLEFYCCLYLVVRSELSRRADWGESCLRRPCRRTLADGGYENLASFLLNRPRQALLEPFLAPHFDLEATDRYGRTRICNAVICSTWWDGNWLTHANFTRGILRP